MAGPSKEKTPQVSPPARDHRSSETSGSFYKSERQSSIPVPIPSSNPGNTSQPSPFTNPPPSTPKPAPGPGPGANQPPQPNAPATQHRFLTPTEWARVAHGIGAIREGEEEHQVVHPTCWYWPPKGMPDGLYRDVVAQRAKYALGFQLLSVLHWFLMILQVMVGAVLTALGSLPVREGTPITALAAVNTVGAGLLGLMHNSGMPDRYRMDKAQFVQVEDYIKAVLDTGIVDAEQKAEDVLNECYGRLANARAIVLSNKPDVYSATPTPGKTALVPFSVPSAHVHARNHTKRQ